MKRKIQSGHKILLNAQLAHVERMSKILRVHKQADLAVCGNRKLCGHNVNLGIRIMIDIQTIKILVGLVNLLRMERAELSIRSGVAEVKGKLPGLHLRRKSIGR